jgi:hypothetical protein
MTKGEGVEEAPSYPPYPPIARCEKWCGRLDIAIGRSKAVSIRWLWLAGASAVSLCVMARRRARKAFHVHKRTGKESQCGMVSLDEPKGGCFAAG